MTISIQNKLTSLACNTILVVSACLLTHHILMLIFTTEVCSLFNATNLEYDDVSAELRVSHNVINGRCFLIRYRMGKFLFYKFCNDGDMNTEKYYSYIDSSFLHF